MRVTRSEHDACLRAAWAIRERIQRGEIDEQAVDADLVALNVVAGGYACDMAVPRKFWQRAQEIIAA